jgi:hypothetical protein
MAVADEWQRLKVEVQQDADRLIARATTPGIRRRIEADVTAMLCISDPANEHELSTRHKIFELLRKEWRISVMDNQRPGG